MHTGRELQRGGGEAGNLGSKLLLFALAHCPICPGSMRLLCTCFALQPLMRETLSLAAEAVGEKSTAVASCVNNLAEVRGPIGRPLIAFC